MDDTQNITPSPIPVPRTNPNVPDNPNPAKSFFANKKILIVILAVVVIGALLAFYFLTKESDIIVTPTITPSIEPREFKRSTTVTNVVADSGQLSTVSGNVLYVDEGANTIARHDQRTNSSTILLSNILGSGEKAKKLIASPDHNKALLEFTATDGALERYLIDFSSGTKTKIPPIMDVVWKSSDEIVEVFFENNSQMLKVYSLSQNKFVFQANIDDLPFDRLLGYDPVNKTIYFTAISVPEGYQEGDLVGNNVSIIAISEVTGVRVVLKDGVPDIALAFIDGSVFYDDEDGIHRVSWSDRSGKLFYSNSSGINFNIEQCDGYKDIIYCVNNDARGISLVSVDGASGRLSRIFTDKPVFAGKVSLKSKNPLTLSVYDEFQNKLLVLGN